MPRLAKNALFLRVCRTPNVLDPVVMEDTRGLQTMTRRLPQTIMIRLELLLPLSSARCVRFATKRSAQFVVSVTVVILKDLLPPQTVLK
jgi:hypothetical protein